MKILKSCKQLREQLSGLEKAFALDVTRIGRVLLGGKDVFRLAMHTSITPQEFLTTPHKMIWRAIARVAKSEEDLTVVTVANELMRRSTLEYVGGLTYLCEICRQFSAQEAETSRLVSTITAKEKE